MSNITTESKIIGNKEIYIRDFFKTNKNEIIRKVKGKRIYQECVVRTTNERIIMNVMLESTVM